MAVSDLPPGFVLDGQQSNGLPPGFVLDQQATQSSPNLFQRIGQDYNSDVNSAQQMANSFVGVDNNGNLTKPTAGAEVGPEMMLKIASIGPQAIGEAGKSLYNIAPQSLKDLISSAANKVGQLPSFSGNTIGQDIPQETANLAQKYQQFAQQNPGAANALGAIGNTVNIAGMGMGIDQAAELMKAFPDAVVNAVDEAGNIIPKSMQSIAPESPLTAQQKTAQIRKDAGNLYQQSKNENISLSDDQSINLSNNLAKLQPSTDLENRSWQESGAAKQVQDITDSLKTENPTLTGLLARRSDLNSDIKAASRSGNDKEVQKLMQVKDALDESMMDSPTQTWQLANHKWAQQAILGDTDEMVNAAATRAQPANSLDTAINSYLRSYKSNGLSPEERAALENVTKNSSFDKLRKGAASGLLKYAAGAAGAHGGPAGPVAGYLMGHYGSEFMKDSAMTAKLAKLDKFRELVENRTLKSAYPVSDTTFGPPSNMAQVLRANRGPK